MELNIKMCIWSTQLILWQLCDNESMIKKLIYMSESKFHINAFKTHLDFISVHACVCY